jgi:glycerophosphoryl diester phosphodiesterase
MNKRKINMKATFLLFGLFFLSFSCGGNDTDLDDSSDTKTLFTVEITCNNTAPTLFEAVSFAAKVPGGGSNITVAWNFGDGFSASGIAAQHGFRAEGTHTVSVTVTDGGKTTSADKIITVAGYSLSKALKNFDRNRVWLMAHRCNTGELTLPENSIASLRRCIQLRNEIGLDFVEIDPRMTRDGVMVIMHDETVNRTTNGTGKVSDLSLAQIKSLRLKALNGTLTDEQVPTIQEFLAEAKDKMWVNLDFSDKVPHTNMYNEVKNCGMLEECLFPVGSNTEMASSLLGFSPKPVVRSSVGSESAVNTHKGMGIYVTTIAAGKVVDRAGFIQSAIVAGFVVMSQTLVQDGINIDNDMRYNDNYSGIDLFVNQGINIIQTDYAPWMDTYLKSKNKR